MGRFRQLVADGFPFRPPPWELARIMADWHPGSDPVSDLDLPDADEFTLVPRNSNPTLANRIDLSADIAWRSRRIFGMVVRIETTTADNTTTPFRIDVMTRICFTARGHAKKTVSTIYVLIQAYSSNIMITDPVSVSIGDIVTGLVSANYNGAGRAQLTAWRHSDFSTWHGISPNTCFTEHLVDLEEWTADWSLILGGANFAEHAPLSNRIFSARMIPPADDPHIFIQDRRERINKEGEDRETDPNVPNSSTRRGRSAVRFSSDTYVRPRGRPASRPKAP